MKNGLTFIAIGLSKGTEILLFASDEFRAWRSSPALREPLLRRLPGLRDHPCVRGRPGGFLDVLQEGTDVGHVLEHCTLAILGKSSSAAATIREERFFRIYFPGIGRPELEPAFQKAIEVLSDAVSESEQENER